MIEGAWVSPDGAVIVDEIRQAGHHPSLLDVQIGVETPFPSLPGNLVPIGRVANGSWVALYYSSTSPVDLVRFTWEPGGELGRIISLTRVWERTDLDHSLLTRAKSFHWHSADGLPLQGWLYRAQPNPHRTVIYIHGGPSSHSEDKLDPQLQYLVSQGFNVLDVNYRGSTGFSLGKSIKEEGWGGREQCDIEMAAEVLIQKGLAKPGGVGVTGTSSAAIVPGVRSPLTREIIAAAAPICGMTDLVVDYNTTRPDLAALSAEMLGGTPQEAPERYFQRSPIISSRILKGNFSSSRAPGTPMSPPRTWAPWSNSSKRTISPTNC